MTPDQIESAARELCKMRGQDENWAERRPVFHPSGRLEAKSKSLLAWAQEEVERFAQVGTAIAAVMQREAPAVAMKTPRKKKATKGLDSRPRPV